MSTITATSPRSNIAAHRAQQQKVPRHMPQDIEEAHHAKLFVAVNQLHALLSEASSPDSGE